MTSLRSLRDELCAPLPKPARYRRTRSYLVVLDLAAIFEFEGDGLVCERVYFDSATILRQLGIAHDPLTLKGRVATVLNHPVTIGRALARRVIGR